MKPTASRPTLEVNGPSSVMAYLKIKKLLLVTRKLHDIYNKFSIMFLSKHRISIIMQIFFFVAGKDFSK